MRPIALAALVFLLAASTMAADKRAPAFDYAGSVMVSCDVNDGPASQMALEPATASDGRVHILVHDLTPPDLRGVIALSNAGYAQASASLSRCEGRSEASCRTASEGSITIVSHTGSVVQGRLRFRFGDGSWRGGTFRAVVTRPPRPLLCG